MYCADKNQPGRKKRTKGGYTPGMFSGITTVKEFATTLGVPNEAINYVLPTNKNADLRIAHSMQSKQTMAAVQSTRELGTLFWVVNEGICSG